MPNPIIYRRLISASRVAFSPAQLNPDLWLDATGMEFQEDNAYGKASDYFLTSRWYNRSTAIGATHAIQNTNASMPFLLKQGIGANNALSFGNNLSDNGHMALAKYAAIDFAHIQQFYIFFTIQTTEAIFKAVIDSRNVTSTRQGIMIQHSNGVAGKLRFVFYDAVLNKFVVVQVDTIVNDGLSHSILFKNSGAGNASGITCKVDGVTSPVSTIVDDVLTNVTGIGNSYYIGALVNSTTTVFQGYIGGIIMGAGDISDASVTNLHNYFIRQVRWAGVKGSTNPVLNGYVGENATSSYPGFIWKEGASYYAIAGSNFKIVGYTGTDEDSFTQSNVVIPLGAGGQWDDAYIPGGFVRKVGALYYLFYTGSPDTGANFSFGYATSANPISGYTKFGSNPIYTAAMYNTQMGRNMTGVVITGHVVSDSGTHNWYGTAINDYHYEIFHATSSSITGTITAQSILFKGSDPDYKRNLLQQPDVIKTTWGWLMSFTVGMSQAVYQERRLCSAYCTSSEPTSFTLTDEDILHVGKVGTWEERRVYGSYFLKNIDDGLYRDLIQVLGQNIKYYSGHSIDADNTGLTGIVRLPSIPDIRSLRTPRQISWTSSVVDNISGGVAWIDASKNTWKTNAQGVYMASNRFDKNKSFISPDANMPLLVDGVLNSKPIIRFNGTTNFMSASKELGHLSSYTIFVLCSFNDLASFRYICGGLDAAGSVGSIYALIGNHTAVSGSIRVANGDGTNYSDDRTSGALFTAVDQFQLITVTYQAGDTFSNIYKRGVLQSKTSLSSAASGTGIILGEYCLGRGGKYNGNYFKGNIAIWGMLNRVLTSMEMDDITNEIISDWGI